MRFRPLRYLLAGSCSLALVSSQVGESSIICISSSSFSFSVSVFALLSFSSVFPSTEEKVSSSFRGTEASAGETRLLGECNRSSRKKLVYVWLWEVPEQTLFVSCGAGEVLGAAGGGG